MDTRKPSTHPAAPDTTSAAPANPTAHGNRWSRDKMQRFIEMLAETGSVREAARAVGMSRQSAYRIRARLLGQPFDLAWEAAFEFGLQQIAHEALDRALNGTVVPVYYMGERIDERRVFNERGALALMLNAEKIGRNHLARDWASRNWVDMAQRVGSGPLKWTEEELAESRKVAAARETESFVTQSQYAPPMLPAPRKGPRISVL